MPGGCDLGVLVWSARWGGEQWLVDEDDIHDFLEHVRLHFRFEHSRFQKPDILPVDLAKYCFLAAHTRARNTVVEDYAIALATEVDANVFCSSPAKKLINLKFRDCLGNFKDVDLAHDVSNNSDAQCVMMMTAKTIEDCVSCFPYGLLWSGGVCLIRPTERLKL